MASFLAKIILTSSCLIGTIHSAQIGERSSGTMQKVCNNRGPTWVAAMGEDLKKIGLPLKTNYEKIPHSPKACSPVDESVGENNGAENALWYYREDLLVNSQHIFWHMSHPQNLFTPEIPLTIDRRGEMFYYLHRNIIARYDAERMSNGLRRVVPFIYEEGAPVAQGYDPHLLEAPHEYRYPARLDNETFSEITDSVAVKRILESDIDSRRLVPKNGAPFVPLDNFKGIDHLGELLEASINSVNDERYLVTGLHSHGHRALGRLHVDIGESIGDDLVCAVIFNPSTAMRDTCFYRWHKVVDELFYRHQALLEPHHPVEGEFPLLWPGVSVQSVSVHVDDDEGQRPSNELATFHDNLTVNIPLTKDIFISNETHEYCIRRLNYHPFTYNITIDKQAFVKSDKATVRIFLAPRFNEEGQRYNLTDQNKLFFALDSFTANLDVGTTVITRHSTLSNLLGKWNLERWEENPPNNDNPECGCGWPQHLLLPRGTAEGMTFDLFVMLTDAQVDLVDEPIEGKQREAVCEMGLLFCGVEGRKYPDKRPMGYPFDTRPFSISTQEGNTRVVTDLEEYVSLLPNTKGLQVLIKHEG